MIAFLGLVWAGEPEASWVTASLVVQVEDREAAISHVIELAEQEGGYFSELGDTRVVVRVPPAELDALMTTVAAEGVVVSKSYNQQDLSAELTNLKARLGSRQEALDRYFLVMKDASSDAVVSLGREITRTIQDIESIQGRVRALEAKAALGQLAVEFKYVDRRAPIKTGNSSFGWLNNINLTDLVQSFRWYRGTGDAKGVDLTLPDDFARFSKKNLLSALTPDDVKMRARTFKNKPKADLAFWQEVAHNRMLQAGYQIVEEGDTTGTGLKGHYLLLAAPAGEQDFLYLVSIYVDGNKIIVVEFAGPGDRVVKRKDALIESLGTVQ